MEKEMENEVRLPLFAFYLTLCSSFSLCFYLSCLSNNRRLKKLFLLFFLFTFYFSSLAQNSCGIRIILLTCTPGKELYSSFGHSALRVADSINNYDLIFNYGTFDFYDPDFYNKFVKGKLLYFVSIDSLHSFLEEYDYYKRGITEQAINISCEEKRKLVSLLFENAKEENKYY